MLVDRRLSYPKPLPPRDDAVKVMTLETTDGVGLLAYAGLGATSGRMQPSDWMSAVLRGRGGLTFEQSLGILSTVATRELPRHLLKTRDAMHFIVIPAFIDGIGPRHYSIDNVLDPVTGRHWFRYTSWQYTTRPGSPPPRIAVAGSGGIYLDRLGRGWGRALLSLVAAHDRGKVSDESIADRLSKINYAVSEKVDDVGPRSIVVWLRRRDARRPASGGGHQYYTGIDRDLSVSEAVPTIASGLDVRAITSVLMRDFQKRIADLGVREAFRGFGDGTEQNRMLAEIPDKPDETLR
jgi:hypothetical protein